MIVVPNLIVANSLLKISYILRMMNILLDVVDCFCLDRQKFNEDYTKGKHINILFDHIT